MFSQTSVILSTGGVHGGGVHDRGSMHGRGVCGREHVWWGTCISGGMHGRDVHGRGMNDRGYEWQGACVRGVCMVAGGVCGRGHAWQGGMRAGEMATATDGIHPTGMHSCLMKFT